MRSMRWLRIGMGVKRYVVGIMVGTVFVSLAIAMVLATVYRTVDFPESTSAVVGAVTLQWIAHPMREIIVGTFGICVMAGSVFLLFRSVISVVIAPGEDVAEMVYRGRLLRRGPQVVSIGGGTGQGVLLRGLKERTANITAVVTVADDGGSSGRLRKEFQLMPPGDLRNCLASLADSEALMTKLLDYRFRRGDGLQGHSLGNLLIAAMRDIAGGVERGVEGLSEVLRIHGSVTPSTASDVHLAAEMVDGTTVIGESRIGSSRRRIHRVYLHPSRVVVNDDAVSAILAADLIVIGPGSVYTSILPNLLVPEIAAAVRQSAAMKLFVVNVTTEPGETESFDLLDHVQAIEDHVGPNLFDFILVNSDTAPQLPAAARNRSFVLASASHQAQLVARGYETFTDSVISHELPVHHDSEQLASTIFQIYYAAEGQTRSPVIELHGNMEGKARNARTR